MRSSKLNHATLRAYGHLSPDFRNSPPDLQEELKTFRARAHRGGVDVRLKMRLGACICLV